MLSKKAKTRLMKLVKFMERLPRSAEEHFDMSAWFQHDGDHKSPIRVGRSINRTVMKDCNTTACALGWAATMPYFNKLGLRVKHDGGIGELCYKRETNVDYWEIEDGRNPLFGISRDQWMKLFSGSSRVKTPKAWALRARKLIERWSAAK